VADQRLRYEEDRGVQKAEDEGDPADAAVLRQCEESLVGQAFTAQGI